MSSERKWYKASWGYFYLRHSNQFGRKTYGCWNSLQREATVMQLIYRDQGAISYQAHYKYCDPNEDGMKWVEESIDLYPPRNWTFEERNNMLVDTIRSE